MKPYKLFSWCRVKTLSLSVGPLISLSHGHYYIRHMVWHYLFHFFLFLKCSISVRTHMKESRYRMLTDFYFILSNLSPTPNSKTITIKLATHLYQLFSNHLIYISQKKDRSHLKFLLIHLYNIQLNKTVKQ